MGFREFGKVTNQLAGIIPDKGRIGNKRLERQILFSLKKIEQQSIERQFG